MSARRHPASLVPVSFHNPYLVNLVARNVSTDMAGYIALQFTQAIRFEGEPEVGGVNLPTPPPTPSRTKVSFTEEQSQRSAAASLQRFILHLVKSSGVRTATLLTTLVYLQRLKTKMPAMSKGMPDTRHRVFLATLIVSAKYLNDSSPKNSHWAHYIQIFTLTEINLMERQLVFLLDYDLRFDEQEAMTAWAPFMPRMSAAQRQCDASMRSSVVDKVTRASRVRSQRLPPTPPSESEPEPVDIDVSEQRSRAHLSVPSASSSMSSISSRNAPSLRSNISSDSSEMGSLMDDNGSSSSSSEWMSSSEDEASDAEVEPRAPNGLKKFVLRPVPAYGYKNTNPRVDRARMPSDTSTIMGLSPVARFRRSSAANGKRSNSISYTSPVDEESSIATSMTLPALAGNAGTRGGFLSRMWGAATNSKDSGLNKGAVEIADPSSGTSSAFRRLVLVNSRPNVRQGSLNV